MSLHIFPPVCAEAFNPDEDDEDTEPRVVHPKTDEQRCRLQEACRDILLFKTLDQVNLIYKQTQTKCSVCCVIQYICRSPRFVSLSISYQLWFVLCGPVWSQSVPAWQTGHLFFCPSSFFICAHIQLHFIQNLSPFFLSDLIPCFLCWNKQVAYITDKEF